jgi:hypothetical protein
VASHNDQASTVLVRMGILTVLSSAWSGLVPPSLGVQRYGTVTAPTHLTGA